MATPGIALVVLVALLWPGSPPTPQARFENAFRPVPKSLLFNGQMLFGRLDQRQLAHVRVTPTMARRIAVANSEAGPSSPVVYESLGGYVNKEQIVHDWVGTRTYIPPAQPAYIVRLSGQEILSSGPVGQTGFNRFLNVIVNAENGKVIMSFSLD